MSDLKPCPFCGGEVSFWTRQAHEAEEYQALIIECEVCPANMEEWVYKYDKNFAENFEKKKAEMYEAWNRRIERTKGKWVEYPDCLQYEGAYADDQIVCSACHHVFSIMDNCTEEFDYCPSCGARLEWDE